MTNTPLYFTNESFHKHHRLLTVIELAKTYYKIYYGKLFNCPNPLIKTMSSLSYYADLNETGLIFTYL